MASNRLLLTGDVHGNIIQRFKDYPLSENDTVIILGDVGVPFGVDNPLYKQGHQKHDIEQLTFVQQSPAQFIFIAGNHDDRCAIASMPKVKKYGRTVRQFSYHNITCNNAVYVSQAGIFNICGLNCLIIPGARSTDIYNGIIDPSKDGYATYFTYGHMRGVRTLNLDWWEDETIPIFELEHQIEKEKWSQQYFDLVLTHDCPGIWATLSGYNPSDNENFLERVRNEVPFNQWFFGHVHQDIDMTHLLVEKGLYNYPDIDRRLRCLYYDIYQIIR